jgi:hypothetical protein
MRNRINALFEGSPLYTLYLRVIERHFAWLLTRAGLVQCTCMHAPVAPLSDLLCTARHHGRHEIQQRCVSSYLWMQ